MAMDAPHKPVDPSPREDAPSQPQADTGAAPFSMPRTRRSRDALDRPHHTDQFSRYFLLGLLLLIGVSFLPLLAIFLVPVILAAALCTLSYPLYEAYVKLCGKNRPLASFLSCLSIALCVLAPLFFAARLSALQAVQLYNEARPFFQDLLAKGAGSEIVRRINERLPTEWLSQIAFSRSLDIVEQGREFASRMIANTSAGVFELVFNLFVMLFTMFYFFLDGKRIVAWIRYLSPLRREYEDMIINRFLLISRATIKGNFVVALIQGVAGALVLLVFGVKTWVLLGAIMVILASIPLMGTWMVLLPAALLKAVGGNVVQAVGIALCSVLVVSNIDNILRPRLVGRGAHMHDLMIFFSILGGIRVFGVLGIIVGPVVIAFFVSLLEIYAQEFKVHLIYDESYSHTARPRR